MSARSGRAGTGLRVSAFLVMAFLYLPLAIVLLYAFTTQSTSFTFPPPGLTTAWFGVAFGQADMWSALRQSLAVASIATMASLALGGLLAAAVYRARFFGRDALAFVVVLPIALPGIVTGLAIRSFAEQATLPIGFWTIVIGHTTFCIVIVYNNVVSRLRRMSPNIVEASSDLGASGWQTFRWVIWPNLATAVLAGGVLAFALSFDEIIVTTFTRGPEPTLPIYIYNLLFRPRNKPVTNVVALIAIAFTFIPVLVAQLLTRDPTERGSGMMPSANVDSTES